MESLSHLIILIAIMSGISNAFGPPTWHGRIGAVSNAPRFAEPSAMIGNDSGPKSSVGPPFKLQRIDHIVIRCKNFPSMFDFYHRILGCTIDEPKAEHVNRFGGALTHLRAGSCYIDLLAYDTKHLNEEGKEAAARMHAGGSGIDLKSLEGIDLSADSSTLDHLCIRVDPFDVQIMIDYLEGENVSIVTSGDKRLGADGIGPSVYVRDPEGNVIELKGSPCKGTAEYKDESHTSSLNMHPINKVDRISHQDDDKNPAEKLQTEKPDDSSKIPITPCNRICRYNSSFYDGKVCIGCFREAYEIEMWQTMSPAEKSMALFDAIDRLGESEQPSLSVTGSGEEFFEGAVSKDDLTRQYKYWNEKAKSR